MDRRQFLKTSGLALAASATGTLAMPFLARAQSGPIRIGLMAPLSGVVAAGGREIAEGFNMFWEEKGNNIGGRKVEVLVEDDAGNPDTALQKARRLVEQSKVDFLFGNLLANTGLAVANYVKGNGVPYFIPVIAADDLTQRQRVKNVIRVAGYTASQMPRPLADWALKQGYKRIATISQDYTFGHEQCAGFAQVFTEGGGEIVAQLWNPLNTADFSPYIGQIASANVDAVFAMELGADAARFIKQYSDFGLKGQLPLLGAQNFTDQSVIRTLGPECEGIISSAHFAEGSDNPATQNFVKAYSAKYGKLPSLYGFSHYSGAMWIGQVIEQLNGDISNRDGFIDAVLKSELDNSPLGRPVKFDDYGNPVYDVYIRKVEKTPEGKFWNVPVETYPSVSQFWTYNADEYLKNPPFSRTNQGIKK
ncbi:ABC transporter substrate-binding protein [Terrihabitans sp. B22-R8]|uniref:ABC transporter substrate-binding protein n=1 Tax=Terrihabitans sp. B22-R8 TaxID=3425128 RepID=UPI00403D18F8